MKIAIFSDCYLDLPGGIVSSINAQKTALEKNGHTVYIFSPSYPKTEKEKAELAKRNIFVVPSCRWLIRGVTPISRRPSVIEKWLLKYHPEIKNFDVFYIHYEAGCSISAMKLGKKLGIPTVQVMHGREDMGETKLIPFPFKTIVAIGLNRAHAFYIPHRIKIKKDDLLADSFAKAKMWELMVNHVNYADLAICPSKHFAKKLSQYGAKKKIWILPNGYPDEKFLPDLPTKKLEPGETLKIIWHSRVSGEKRIMPFLKALKEVRTGYKLDVYGGGPDLPRAKKYASANKLKVVFHGNTAFEKVQKAITEASLDVLVSYNYDNYPLTLVEAEATCTPVFICDPDMKEIVPEGSYVISKTESPEDMVEALNDLLEHPDRIAKMSKTMAKNRGEVLISKRIKILEKILSGIIKT